MNKGVIMDKKQINKEIRKISNSSFLPALLFVVFVYGFMFCFKLVIKLLSESGVFVNDDIVYLIAYTIQFAIVIPLILLIFYKTRGKKTGLKLKTAFQKPKMSAWWIIKWSVISISFGYITSFVSSFIFSLIEKLFGIQLHAVNISVGDSPISILTIILATMVYAPIFEELLCRATVYRNNEIMGQPFAIVISGLFFGLIHMNYSQIPFAMVLGGLFAFMYAKTRSIIPAMIVHFIINSLSTTLMLCYTSMGVTAETLDTMDTEAVTNLMLQHIPAMLIVVAIIFLIFSLIATGVVFFIIELVKNRNQLKLRKGIFEISTAKKITVYFTAPITLITLAVLLVMTITNAMG